MTLQIETQEGYTCIPDRECPGVGEVGRRSASARSGGRWWSTWALETLHVCVSLCMSLTSIYKSDTSHILTLNYSESESVEGVGDLGGS